MVTALQNKKVILAKLGMDAHWRGVIVIARALRDAGMEVLYLGHVRPVELANVVVQEDPALVGLSAMSGNHLTEVPAVLRALERAGAVAPVVVGGAISAIDAEVLCKQSVAAVFPTGSLLPAIIDEIALLVTEHGTR